MMDSGNGDLVDAIANGSGQAIFAEQSRQDPNLYFLRVDNPDGTVRTLTHADNQYQLVTLDANELRESNIEIRKEAEASVKGVEFGEFVRKNTPSTGNEAARENVQGVKDWFLKDYVKSKGDWSIIYNAFYAAPVATISNAVVDTAKKMFHANPEAALAMPINNVENLAFHTMLPLTAIIPNKEVNDIFFTRLMDNKRATSEALNAKKKQWTPEQLEAKLKLYETSLIEEVGLTRP